MKTYRNRVWDLLDSLLEINFISIPRRFNQIANALMSRGAHYNPAYQKGRSYGVKVLCRPSVPNTTNVLVGI